MALVVPRASTHNIDVECELPVLFVAEAGVVDEQRHGPEPLDGSIPRPWGKDLG